MSGPGRINVSRDPNLRGVSVDASNVPNNVTINVTAHSEQGSAKAVGNGTGNVTAFQGSLPAGVSPEEAAQKIIEKKSSFSRILSFS